MYKLLLSLVKSFNNFMMPSKSNTFICDQQASNISRELQTFYQDQLFFDITLAAKTDNIKVHAHRTVLSASSDYFRAMLSSTLKEAKSDVVELGIDGATLKLVIDFMYSGTIELRFDNVELVLIAADYLIMDTLKVACCDFIGESIDFANCLGIASLAKQQQSAELHKKAFKFALQEFEEVRMQEEFLQITEAQLTELISSDDLCVDSEETVFHSLVSWVEYDKGNREKCLIDLLSHVCFSYLKPEFIKKNRHSVCKNMETLELICSWQESHLLQTTLSKRHSERKRSYGRETLGLVSGVWTDNLKFQTFDRRSNTWSCEGLPPPPTKRKAYRAIVVDKKLIIAGGMLNRRETNIVECLDLQTREWTNLPPMRQKRSCPGMAELNGDLYVVGGYSGRYLSCSGEKYDFRTREWQELTPMHSPFDCQMVAVVGELLYALSRAGPSIECYNPASNKWSQISHKNENSCSFGIAGFGGHLYAVGGWYNGEASKIVERYNPSTDTWTVISPGLQLGLSDLLCVSWNNRLIAYRGYNNENKYSNLVEEYNPEANEWKTSTSPLEHDLDLISTSLFTFRK